MHLIGEEFRRSTLPSLAFLELTFAHLLADSINGIQPTIRKEDTCSRVAIAPDWNLH